MNEHQRAGLRSVWEVYRIMLLMIGGLALVAGISYSVFRVTQSTGWAVGVGLVLVYGTVYGWITRDL